MAKFLADVQLCKSNAKAPSANWPHVKTGWPNHALGMAVLGRIALTKIHARELAPRGITANCCCPWGIIATGSVDPDARTLAQCADTPAWLAAGLASPATGQFFKDRAAVAW